MSRSVGRERRRVLPRLRDRLALRTTTASAATDERLIVTSTWDVCEAESFTCRVTGLEAAHR